MLAFLVVELERFELERRRRDARHPKSTSLAMGDWSGGEYVKTVAEQSTLYGANVMRYS